MAEIKILNYDVLIEIFSYLDIYERQRMGLVCKKWQNVIEIMMGSIHKMWLGVTDDDKRGRILQIRHDVLKVSTNDPIDLEKPWKKFANNLNEIQIEYSGRKRMPSKIYKLLAKSTQLKYARFEYYKMKSLGLLLEFLPTENLEKLSIHLVGHEYGSVRPEWNHLMGNILSKTPKLKALELNFVPISELSSIGGMGTLEALFIQMKALPRLNFDMNELRNLKTLCLSCQGYRPPDIVELMRKCRKLHSVEITGMYKLPIDVINEMISLPNLRRLYLWRMSNTCEWHKFSNLEEIRITCYKRFPTTRYQIMSFLKRSKNLKYYDIWSRQHKDFNRLVRQVAHDIGHEFKRYRWENWTRLPDIIE